MRLILQIVLISLAVTTLAQESRTVEVTVKLNNRKPLKFEPVTILGTKVGTMTDHKGRFSFKVPKDLPVYFNLNQCYGGTLIKVTPNDPNRIRIVANKKQLRRSKMHRAEWERDSEELVLKLQAFYNDK